MALNDLRDDDIQDIKIFLDLLGSAMKDPTTWESEFRLPREVQQWYERAIEAIGHIETALQDA